MGYMINSPYSQLLRNNKDLREIQQEAKIWTERNFGPTKPGSSMLSLLGIVEEVGELSHSHLKREQRIRGDPHEHRIEQLDALGDILIYMLDYCNREDIDLLDTLRDTWASVQKRDWVAYPLTGLEPTA